MHTFIVPVIVYHQPNKDYIDLDLISSHVEFWYLIKLCFYNEHLFSVFKYTDHVYFLHVIILNYSL